MRQSLHNVPAAELPAKTAGEPALVRRRVEITVERETLSVHYQPGQGFTGHCTECGHDVLKLTAEVAAAASGTTPREIYRWLEETDLHFEELPTGQVFICSESLNSLIQARQANCGDTP
jgi:hypothetical protein